MKFEFLKEFEKDVKKLWKKYRALPDDIEVMKKILVLIPDERPPFNFRISDLGITTCVIKIRKIASRSFKGKGVNSGFRLIYAYFEKESKIVLIELYHKSQKEIEDRDRILKYFS